MDKLEKGKQAELKKMTDARLVSKLTQAGVALEELESMDRTSMMDRWAEMVVSGNDSAIASKAAGPLGGGESELERQKLLFKMQQWNDEKLERQAQREEDRLEREYQRKVEADRWAEESSFRAEESIFRQEQLRLQQHQIVLMERKELEDRDNDNNSVRLLKKYGDALRNSIVKLGNDLIDIIPFFSNFERQCTELKVPIAIRVSLLKPFLNDRARLLVNRLASTHANDYDYVKEYLLQ
jgi:uncharacterized protein (DUF885 family)